MKAAAASTLLDLAPATWRHLAGWTTTLPLATDSLQMLRTMDTDALAAAFPFASPDLPAPLPGDPPSDGGVLYGINPASNGIVWWDRWAQDNHNTVVLARSGAGKSYFVKLDVLRSLYAGVQVSVIDPEDEYLRLAAAVGGTVVRLGAPGVKLNPLDLPVGDTRPDVLTRRGLFLHTFIAVLLGRAAGAGRTRRPGPGDPRLLPHRRDHRRPGHPSPAGAAAARPRRHLGRATRTRRRRTLAARLAPWVVGSFKDLFDAADHPPPGRAPRRLVAAAPPRRAAHRRHPAGAGPHLAPDRPPHAPHHADLGDSRRTPAGGWWWSMRRGC